MSWFVICHNPVNPDATSFVKDVANPYGAHVFEDGESTEEWISDKEKSDNFHTYHALEI